MIKILPIEDVVRLIHEVGIGPFIREVIEALRTDFSAWQSFQKLPRVATHVAEGVIELMPICGETHYAFKYVNGHPNNPKRHKQTVIGLGMLSEVATGYPLLVCDMTLLTAIRTAATSALAGQYLARKQSNTMALIGTGAQAEFQAVAFKEGLNIQKIQYFDLDPQAMEKFHHNMRGLSIELYPCKDIEHALSGAHIITTATASKEHAVIVPDLLVLPGTFINGIGGDCPGKTELDPRLLLRSKIVVEYKAQTQYEGEIQQHPDKASGIYAELWEIITSQRPGRETDDEIILFDSVGFALEDYAIMRLVYTIAERLHIGQTIEWLPRLQDPKNLWSLLR